ncbi:MAG: type II toxin-antitoxin system PemK/MazF family toxin [Thermoleophilia bacterium]|nr:type II toxin-antitoxin system PemK/MazF family toxin [Thermoleophilia bacterium]
MTARRDSSAVETSNQSPGVRTVDDGIRRGEIYSAELHGCAGAAGMVTRPVLVIQNDIGNRYSRSIIVASVTSTRPSHDFAVVVEIPPETLPGLAAICLNQIMMVDRGSLGKKLASLPPETMAAADEALRRSLGLSRNG